MTEGARAASTLALVFEASSARAFHKARAGEATSVPLFRSAHKVHSSPPMPKKSVCRKPSKSVQSAFHSRFMKSHFPCPQLQQVCCPNVRSEPDAGRCWPDVGFVSEREGRGRQTTSRHWRTRPVQTFLEIAKCTVDQALLSLPLSQIPRVRTPCGRSAQVIIEGRGNTT